MFRVCILYLLQEFLPDTGQTAQNSMSLNRAPGQLANDIRGSSLNVPFWPGKVFVFIIISKLDTLPDFVLQLN